MNDKRLEQMREAWIKNVAKIVMNGDIEKSTQAYNKIQPFTSNNSLELLRKN